MLNEKLYNEGELGITSKKISQVSISKRLTYERALAYVREVKWEGYVAITNSDIFLDHTIRNLYTSCLSFEPAWYTLLRFEYEGQADPGQCSLSGRGRLRPDSQDAWIYHTAHTISDRHFKHFNFELGRYGCDTKLIFILSLMKFKA